MVEGSTHLGFTKGRTINDLGGGLGQKRDKKLLLFAWEKTQLSRFARKKNSSASWPGIKTPPDY